MIMMHKQAVTSTTDNHHNYAIYFNNLEIILKSRFALIESMDDLNQMIQMMEQAVASTSDDYKP